MKLRSLILNILFRGRPFKAKKIEFDIEESFPARQTIQDIVGNEALDVEKNARAFRPRIKKKEELKPLFMTVELGEDGKLYKDGQLLGDNGIEIRTKEALATAKRSRENNAHIESKLSTMWDQALPPGQVLPK